MHFCKGHPQRIPLAIPNTKNWLLLTYSSSIPLFIRTFRRNSSGNSGTTGYTNNNSSTGHKIVMSINRKVVIIRGPAGSGKSTVTQLLLKKLKEQSVVYKGTEAEKDHLYAYLEQDYFRHVVCGGYKGHKEVSEALMLANAKVCFWVSSHYGIMNIKRYREIFDQLIELCGLENVKFYYLNASLELTKERHAGREKAKAFDADELASWYSSASSANYPTERILEASQYAAEEVVNLILEDWKNGKF